MLQSVKLKTVFIPLASTTSSSSPSPSTPPLDDGITTVKHYIYLHSNLKPRTHDTPRSTTSIGMTTSNANPTVSATAPVLSDAVQRCVDTAAEAIATYREARLTFLQGLVRRMMRETYREFVNPPSVGIPTTQSGIDGATTRGIYPSFVIHPNYQNGQIHYPPNPISNPPTTSATTTTTTAKMTSTQKVSTAKPSSATATNTTASYPNTIASPANEAHRPHTVFAPMSLVESLTKTFFLWLI